MAHRAKPDSLRRDGFAARNCAARRVAHHATTPPLTPLPLWPSPGLLRAFILRARPRAPRIVVRERSEQEFSKLKKVYSVLLALTF